MKTRQRSIFRAPLFCLALIVILQPGTGNAGDLKDIWEIAKEVYCMAFDCDPAPQPPPAEVQIGYLVVFVGSSISNVSMLKDKDRLCAPRKHIEYARLLPEVFRSELTVMPPAEIYTGLQTGVCKAALLLEPGEDKRYPAGTTGVEFVPVYIEESLYNSRKKFLDKAAP